MPTTQPSKIAGRGLVNEAEFAKKSGSRGSGGGLSPETTKYIKIGVVVLCLVVAGILISMQFAGGGARDRAGQPTAPAEPIAATPEEPLPPNVRRAPVQVAPQALTSPTP
jgi:hypothetical protein